MKILVTGAAGFHCFHLVSSFAVSSELSELTTYLLYDPNLKSTRLSNLGIDVDEFKKTKFYSSNSMTLEMYLVDIAHKDKLAEVFSEHNIDIVVNLAAQAGVRYARENPDAYVSSNLVGFCNLLELTKEAECAHFIYASSSSVYGDEKLLPYHEGQNVNTPLNLYAATKKSNEMLAKSYSHLFQMKTTGLRFFTVYGPYGRPDMAYFKFTEAILEGRSIDVYGQGKVFRDFTYVDDIIEGILAVIDDKESRTDDILNIGCGSPDTVSKMVESLELILKKKALINWKDLPKDDMPHTYCCVKKFNQKYGFKAETKLHDGLSQFVRWYESYLSGKDIQLENNITQDTRSYSL